MGLSIPCAFTIPVLVIDAPLLSVVYAPGSDKLLITQIDRGALLWKHVVAGHSRIGVYVVHRSYAKAFLGECFKSAQWWTQFPDSLLNEAYENRRERESRP